MKDKQLNKCVSFMVTPTTKTAMDEARHVKWAAVLRDFINVKLRDFARRLP